MGGAIINNPSSQSSSADIQIIYDVCWILTPLQIQRMCSNYYVADYEVGSFWFPFSHQPSPFIP